MSAPIARAARPFRRLIPTTAAMLSLAGVTAACGISTASPPIAPRETGLAAQAWIVPQADVVAFVRAHGGPSVDDFVPMGSDPVVVARVTWIQRDLTPDVRYNVVVLDPSGRQAATDMRAEDANGSVSIGWDGRFGVLSERFPFLAATRDVEVDGEWRDAAIGASFRPSFGAPMWLIARFPRNGPIAVAPADATPIVAAFLTGTDEKVWWASPLSSVPLA